jgi:hypothetical protein
MRKKLRDLGRSAITIGACVTLLSGVSAVSAQAADVDAKDFGNIKVCKKVDGWNNQDQKFRFIIREQRTGKIAEFMLRGDDCRGENKLDVGTYRVRERDIPKNCKVTDINVKGPYERINLANAVAVVKVEKNKTTTVTFVDRCKK